MIDILEDILDILRKFFIPDDLYEYLQDLSLNKLKELLDSLKNNPIKTIADILKILVKLGIRVPQRILKLI